MSRGRSRPASWLPSPPTRDPTELEDLVEAEADRARRLEAAYEEWADAASFVSSREREAHRREPK